MKPSNRVLPYRSVWSLDSLSGADLLALLDTAGRLKQTARAGKASAPLRGKNIALLGDRTPTHGDDMLRQAALDLGAKVADLRSAHGPPGASPLLDSARLLGRLYDAVDWAAVSPTLLAQVDREVGVPVFNGLGTDEHPTRVLADLLGMQEHSGKPLSELRLCFIGDADTPCGDALLQAAARTGIDLRIAAPRSRWPGQERMQAAQQQARAGGGHLRFFELPAEASAGADFVLDAASPGRCTLVGAKATLDDAERADNRRFTLQALLVSTLA